MWILPDQLASDGLFSKESIDFQKMCIQCVCLVECVSSVVSP